MGTAVSKWAIFLLVLGGACQAGYFSIAKFLTSSGIPAFGCVLWQIIGGILLFALLCLRKGVWPNFTKSDLTFHLVVALSNILVPNLIVFISASHLPAGALALLGTMSPVCTYLLVVLLRIERIDFLRGTGVALGLLGAVLLATPKVDYGASFDPLWLLLALLLPMSFATSNVWCQKKWPTGQTPEALVLGMLIVSLVLLFPVCLITETLTKPWGDSINLTLGLWVYVLAANAYIFLGFEIIRLAGAVFLSQIGYVVALSGLVLGWCFFSETPNLWVLVAAGLIFAGLALVTRQQQKVAS